MKLKRLIPLILIALLLSVSSLEADSFKRTVSSKAKITGLYVAYFNRAPDKKGLDFWEDKAQKALSRGDDVADVLKELSKGFAKHPTFTSTYDGMSNREFVEAIYRNTLGKAGDEEGIGFWTEYLDGGKSRSDMVSDFVELSLTSEVTAESFPNLTPQQLAVAQERQNLITNKVNVALSFTSLLGVRTNVEDEEDPESDPAYLASIKILRDIVDDDRSVSDAIGFLNSIKNDDDAIGRINNPTPTNIPAQAVDRSDFGGYVNRDNPKYRTDSSSRFFVEDEDGLNELREETISGVYGRLVVTKDGWEYILDTENERVKALNGGSLTDRIHVFANDGTDLGEVKIRIDSTKPTPTPTPTGPDGPDGE